MSQRWIPDIDPDTGLDNGYWIDDDTGTVYDSDNNVVDPNLGNKDPVVDNDNYGNDGAREVRYDDPNGDYRIVDKYGGTTYYKADGTLQADGGTDSVRDPSGSSWTLASVLDKVKSFTGLTGAQLAGLGLGAVSLAGNAPYNPKSPKELLAMQPSNVPAGFTQAELDKWAVPFKTGTDLPRQYAADMVSPIRPGEGINPDGTPMKFAEGGEVPGALSQVFDSSMMQGLVSGEGGGQDDLVEARLSPGEYVFDAESVSMLGDGDNDAGARKLDELREKLRAHKRSAPVDDIAPPARGALSYLGEA